MDYKNKYYKYKKKYLNLYKKIGSGNINTRKWNDSKFRNIKIICYELGSISALIFFNAFCSICLILSAEILYFFARSCNVSDL